ncbi:hypothetical protein ACFLRN_09465 [Thermoproteota archaeon]
MEIKIKKTISVIVVCMLVFTVFSVVMVYSKPESGVSTPFQEVNVTRWLHTTKTDSADVWIVGSNLPVFEEDTTGYREITIKFFIWEGGDDVEFNVLFEIDTGAAVGGFVVDTFNVYDSDINGVVKTYPVQGTDIVVRASKLSADVRVVVWYYITT